MNDERKYKSIPEMFVELCRKSEDLEKPAFRYKQNGEWTTISHSKLLADVSCLAISIMERVSARVTE